MPEDVQYMLGRLEAKVDMLLSIDKRVTALEKWRWQIAGMTTLAVVATGIIVKVWR